MHETLIQVSESALAIAQFELWRLELLARSWIAWSALRS